MEDFIRKQVRKILSEAGPETGRLGGSSAEITAAVKLAESNPAKIAHSFSFSEFSPTGSSNSEKVHSLLRYLVSNDNDLMGIIADVKIEGTDVKIFPKKIQYEQDKVYTIPTGRIGHYVKALLIAAGGIGKVNFKKEKQKVVHSTGAYVAVKNL